MDLAKLASGHIKYLYTDGLGYVNEGRVTMNIKYNSIVMAFVGYLLATSTYVVAHTIDEKIADCKCDQACYTDEVSDLTCSGSSFSFKSHSLPDESHTLMIGITGNNQQFPSKHNMEIRLPLNPLQASRVTQTEPGAVGIAVNGVPIFDPSTQGPKQSSGKPVSAATAGELDECGGHAGRGDDYHYHIAPKCLINELGEKAIDERKQPVGYAADGFPILALGWFDKSNDIEAKLDECRGATDVSGQYFYNIESQGDYAILDCLKGKEQRFARDKWVHRKDSKGKEIQGMPVKLAVTDYQQIESKGKTCYIMSGTLSDEQILKANGGVQRVKQLEGSIFYCSTSCYGQFTETRKAKARGRTSMFDSEVKGCASDFIALKNNGFLEFSN
ncbi:YHYH protein [Marinomonas sp. S3726]|uniref:YHYH protein n=1 Tax=Marinomonas sp. S3726 TaxID=579484 RepID=UPI000695E471|nr:YHYH protein [Marinomonas sp. S3726]